MDSESSLTLIDESSSFQILDKSESFVLLDPAPISSEPLEVLDLESRFDADDEWLQLETGSVISSMSLILKPDGSIQSEYSILDNMHASALNEGCKLIKTRPDIYVEDQTMRKILEYISMFSDEVAACLKLSRSSQSLVSSQKIQEDWEVSSLVDLDDISVEALGLLLDTLEEFGMYKLCLIVCNRYSLSNRIGRYIVGLASRYSFLNESQRVDLKGGAIVQKAAVAYTAVHNMLEMINPSYISLKEKDGKDLGVEAFQGLLLLGYWKKLVYIMDFDNSMALTSSFGDFKNYKQAYLIRVGNSDYDLTKEDFGWVKDINDIENMKLALDSVVCNFHGFLGYGRNRNYLTYTKGDFPEFPSVFRFNEMIWKMFFKLKIAEEFRKDFIVFLTEFLESIRSAKASHLQLHDYYSCFLQIIFASEDSNIVEILNSLSFNDFEMFIDITNHVCFLLTNTFNPLQTSNIFSLLSPLGIRQIINSEVSSVYPFLTHALVHRSSSLINYTTCIPAQTSVPDIEAHYYMTPISSICSTLFNIIKSVLKKVISNRTSNLLNLNPNDLSVRANLFGEIWSLDFISYQVNSKQYKLESYNYLKLDSKTMIEYKNLQTKYKDLIQLGETDYYSEIYLRLTKGPELKRMEKRLRQIENMNNNKNNLLNESSVLKLVRFSEQNYDFSKLTKCSRFALITLSQNYMVNALEATEEVQIKYLWISYHLLKIIKETDYFLEFIRATCKTVFKNDRKYTKSTPIFQMSLGFADIDAYINRSNYYQAYQTILNIFETNFCDIEVEIRTNLLYKAILYWLMSHKTYFVTSTLAKSFLPSCHEEKGVNYIPEAIFCTSNPRILLSYSLMILKELNISDVSKQLKDSIYASIYECIYMIMKYCGSTHEIFSIMRNKENIIVIETAALIYPESRLKDFVGLTDKDWEEFQENYLISNHEKYAVGKWANEAEIYKQLDLDWNKEQYRISKDIHSARIIQKFFNKQFKRKALENLSDINRIKFSSNAGKELISIVYKLHLELNDFYYKVHMKKVLDYHHLFNKYYFIATMYQNCKTIDDTQIEKMILEVNEEIDNFKAWRKAITPEIEAPRKVHKKKYKMRWPMRFRYAKNRR